MRDQWLVGRHSHDDLCGASLQLNHLPRIVILSSLYIVAKQIICCDLCAFVEVVHQSGSFLVMRI
jgi:hypothetical protein